MVDTRLELEGGRGLRIRFLDDESKSVRVAGVDVLARQMGLIWVSFLVREVGDLTQTGALTL